MSPVMVHRAAALDMCWVPRVLVALSHTVRAQAVHSLPACQSENERGQIKYKSHPSCYQFYSARVLFIKTISGASAGSQPGLQTNEIAFYTECANEPPLTAGVGRPPHHHPSGGGGSQVLMDLTANGTLKPGLS